MSDSQKLNQTIQNYWQSRSKGYGLSTVDELRSRDNPYREILKRWLPGNHTDQSALDIGCGPGFLAIELAHLGFNVKAVDSCAAMLEEARNNSRELQIDFILSDAGDEVFANETFDVIVSRNLVWNLPDPQKAYRQWITWLNPGGKLIIFDGNHYRYLSDPNFPNPNYQRTHQNLDGIDVSVMEKIAELLPLTQFRRPEYDKDTLTALGLTHIETVVMSRVGNEIKDFALMFEKNHAN